MSTWHTPETVLAEWEDADQIPQLLLPQLVISAQDAVTAYAPAVNPELTENSVPGDEGSPLVQTIPDRYRVAQLIQVRNLWNASLATASGDQGGELYTFTPRPLDWHVKALLRPAHGRPRVR